MIVRVSGRKYYLNNKLKVVEKSIYIYGDVCEQLVVFVLHVQCRGR